MTRPFLKFDMATGAFLKFNTATGAFLEIQQATGYLSDKRQGYFLNLTCDTGLKIVSDMRQRHLRLSTGDRAIAIFLATVRCDRSAF